MNEKLEQYLNECLDACHKTAYKDGMLTGIVVGAVSTLSMVLVLYKLTRSKKDEPES